MSRLHYQAELTKLALMFAEDGIEEVLRWRVLLMRVDEGVRERLVGVMLVVQAGCLLLLLLLLLRVAVVLVFGRREDLLLALAVEFR